LAREDHFANIVQVSQTTGEPGHQTVAEFSETPVLRIGLHVRFFPAVLDAEAFGQLQDYGRADEATPSDDDILRLVFPGIHGVILKLYY
jgi:hypothetical protein